jgi:hypothetical protein
MFLTSVGLSLNDFLQSYALVLENILSLNCACSLFRISVGFMFSLVRNLTIILCTRAEGTTDKKQVDLPWYVIMVIGIPSLTTSKVILFYMGISTLEKKKTSLYLNSPHIMKTIRKLRKKFEWNLETLQISVIIENKLLW